MTDPELKESFRVVSKPVVKLVAQTTYEDYEIEKWGKERGINFTTDAVKDADALAEFGGRLCYLSFNPEKRRATGEGQNALYLDHIREVGHGSVTEHATFSFVIDDCSRNMTHELVRHRVGVAYSQLSTRYVDQFSDEYFGDSGHAIGIHVPQVIQDSRDLLDDWLSVWAMVFRVYQKSYNSLRLQGYEKKHARSLARHILPGSACTAILFTVNCRELNHIFNMRGSKFADPEIRAMAVALWENVQDHNLFRHWKRETDPVHGEFLRNADVPATLEEALAEVQKKFADELKGCDLMIARPVELFHIPDDDMGVNVDAAIPTSPTSV